MPQIRWKYRFRPEFSNSTAFFLCIILRTVHFQQLPFVTSRHQFQSRDFVDYTAVHPTTTSSPKTYHRPFPRSVKTAIAWIRTKLLKCSVPILPPYASVAGCLAQECFILSVHLECTVYWCKNCLSNNCNLGIRCILAASFLVLLFSVVNLIEMALLLPCGRKQVYSFGVKRHVVPKIVQL